MNPAFADRLIAACLEKNSVVCVGIDPMPEFLPRELLRGQPGSRRDLLDAVYEFCTWVLETVAPHAACVKFQSAYFEAFHQDGVEAYYSLIYEAQSRGLLVIGDIKRGDIGTTSAAYAQAHLTPIQQEAEEAELATPDAITISPFLGLDTIEPFLTEAAATNKGLFALVRTSNPGSASLQDALLQDGRSFAEKLADDLAPLAARHAAGSAYSLLGAVVGATQPHTMVSLRKRLPQSIFLLPGYGAQGATAEMTRLAFHLTPGQFPAGAIVSASRSVLYAHRDPRHADLDWREAMAAAVVEMKTDLNRVLTSPST